MWINRKTGKCWTDEEEADFAQIMIAGNLPRMPAIRLYRRFNSNLEKALKYAATYYADSRHTRTRRTTR